MSYTDEHPIRANGRTIGRVRYHAAQGGYWSWADDHGSSNGQSYDDPEAAETALTDAYWAAAEEFGRDAHAAQAHI